MIMVQSTFHLRAESKPKVIALMTNMVRLCRQEHGCISYEYFAGVTDCNQIILLQEWENADCLQGHYQAEHMDDFMSRLVPSLDKPISTRSYFSQEEGGKIAPAMSNKKPKPEQTVH
jgi:quinol monooxygenase YgiN